MKIQYDGYLLRIYPISNSKMQIIFSKSSLSRIGTRRYLYQQKTWSGKKEDEWKLCLSVVPWRMKHSAFSDIILSIFGLWKTEGGLLVISLTIIIIAKQYIYCWKNTLKSSLTVLFSKIDSVYHTESRMLIWIL